MTEHLRWSLAIPIPVSELHECILILRPPCDSLSPSCQSPLSSLLPCQVIYYLTHLPGCLSASAPSTCASRLCSSPVQPPQTEGLIFNMPHRAHLSPLAGIRSKEVWPRRWDPWCKAWPSKGNAGGWGDLGAFPSFSDGAGELQVPPHSLTTVTLDSTQLPNLHSQGLFLSCSVPFLSSSPLSAANVDWETYPWISLRAKCLCPTRKPGESCVL